MIDRRLPIGKFIKPRTGARYDSSEPSRFMSSDLDDHYAHFCFTSSMVCQRVNFCYRPIKRRQITFPGRNVVAPFLVLLTILFMAVAFFLAALSTGKLLAKTYHLLSDSLPPQHLVLIQLPINTTYCGLGVFPSFVHGCFYALDG